MPHAPLQIYSLLAVLQTFKMQHRLLIDVAVSNSAARRGVTP
jgi:hypothetical protein